MPFQPKEYPVQQVLELACAAQRINGDYLKSPHPIYTADGVYVGLKVTNRELVELTLDATKWRGEQKDHPALLRVNKDDQELAAEIQKYFRKLIFAAIEGENEFLTSVNSALQSETVKANIFGFIVCLPHVYKKDYAKTQFEKRIKNLEREYIDEIGKQLFDLDCEIIQSLKSKNFEGYNIDAIIDNKMVSWLNKTDLTIGPCVVVKAKIKDQNHHWKYGIPVTRLNYVKAAQ